MSVPAGFPSPQPEVFHGAVGEAALRAGRLTEADPVGILACLLAEASALVGRAAQVQVSGEAFPARLFVMLVGPTAEGRKGTAGKVARQVLDLVGIEHPAGFLRHGFASGEALTEALAAADDPRMLVVEEELAAVLVAVNREGSTMSMTLRELWDGRSLSRSTVAGRFDVVDPHVAVIGHITPAELRMQLRQVEQANGLANRFLPVAVHRRQVLMWLDSRPGSAALADELGETTDTLRERLTGTLTPVATMTKKGGDRWWAAYSAARPCTALTARRDSHVLRLATLYAALDGRRAVDADHIEAALALWDYVEASWVWAMGDPTGDPAAGRILEVVRSAGDAGISLTGLTRALSSHLSATDRNRALSVLVEQGLVVRRSVATSGRPREVIAASAAREGSSESSSDRPGRTSCPPLQGRL